MNKQRRLRKALFAAGIAIWLLALYIDNAASVWMVYAALALIAPASIHMYNRGSM